MSDLSRSVVGSHLAWLADALARNASSAIVAARLVLRRDDAAMRCLLPPLNHRATSASQSHRSLPGVNRLEARRAILGNGYRAAASLAGRGHPPPFPLVLQSV